jgi:hypothetical protein
VLGAPHGPAIPAPIKDTTAALGYYYTAADAHERPLCSIFSLIPPTTAIRLPLVGYGGSLLVESRKNGQSNRGIIWWNYLVGPTRFSRPPARPPVAAPPRAPPRALGSGRPAPHRGAPFAAAHSLPVRRPAVVNRLDTALHITVLLHGLYVGVIPIWLHWHDQAAGRHGTTRC